MTYYFPPCSATAGYRPFAWASNLGDDNIKTTVVTRHWESDNNSRSSFVGYNSSPNKVITFNTYKLISLPYNKTLKREIGENWLHNFSLLRKIYYFILAIFGEINIDMDGRAAYSDFLNEYLKNEKYDVIIVTAPPFNLIRLAKELSNKFNIPYIVDFRDLWNNHEMKKGFIYSGTDKILFGLIKKYISFWISDAKLITVATPPMVKFIQQLAYKGKVSTLLNGFERNLYNNHIRIDGENKKFIISCIGTLYAEQDLNIFVEGFKIFLNNNPHAQLQLRFIGVGFDPNVEIILLNSIPAKYLYTSGRVPRDEAINEALQANILYYAGWKGFEGVLTTKIFDYLASKKNILIAPGDGSSIDDIVIKTNSGKIANSAQEVCSLINTWYLEWEKEGIIQYKGKTEIVEKYSRENQTHYFSKLIKELF